MEHITSIVNKSKTSERRSRCFFQSDQKVNGSFFFQPKLTIGPVDDPYEHEADDVADKVMRMSDHDEEKVQPKISPIDIQRKCAECEEEEKQLQKKVGGNTSTEIETPSILNDVVKSSGSSLDPETKSSMENCFGYDFGKVKIHTDSLAANSAQSINALAYTSGDNIVFNQGQYSPDTERGQKLLAHELTHVVQQSGSDSTIQRLTISKSRITPGYCGAREVMWDFDLDNLAPDEGYLVQQVDNHEIKSPCPVVSGPPALYKTFWEAFHVKKGEINHDFQSILGYSDKSRLISSPDTSGTETSYGTVKFFLKSTTGDLGGFQVPPPRASDWGLGKAPESGPLLPSTETEPTWWTLKPIEGPMKRSAFSRWDCCSAQPFGETEAEP